MASHASRNATIARRRAGQAGTNLQSHRVRADDAPPDTPLSPPPTAMRRLGGMPGTVVPTPNPSSTARVGNRAGGGNPDWALIGSSLDAEPLEPLDEIGLLGAATPSDIEKRAIAIPGCEGKVSAVHQERLGSAPLSTCARVPQRLVDRGLVMDRSIGQKLFEAAQHAERGGVPQLLDARAAGYEQPGNVPAAVTNRIVQRRPDRAAGGLDLGSAIDQDPCDLSVVAAGRPMQRGLTGAVFIASIGVGTRIDQHLRNLRPVRKVPRPVSHHVQRRPSLGNATQPAHRDPRMSSKKPTQYVDVTRSNGQVCVHIVPLARRASFCRS